MSSYREQIKNNNQTELNNTKVKLEVRGLYSMYESLEVLDDINIHVNEGEFVSIIGPSGCGKSTLFHHIAGLLKADSGEVYVNGHLVTGEKNHVAYMYQKDLLLPWRKVIDNVALPLEVNKVSKKERVKKVKPFFKTFDLEGFEEYYPSQLSGGMKQRAALMRTYMCEKDIMLLDEPFGRLDAMTKGKMQQWLLRVSKKMTSSILFITHDIEEAIYLSDRIYVLSERPATIIREVKVTLDKSDYVQCTTSEGFNQLKAELINGVN